MLSHLHKTKEGRKAGTHNQEPSLGGQGRINHPKEENFLGRLCIM